MPRPLLALAVFLLASVLGCAPTQSEPCSNGTCVCEPGESCDLPCDAPPCHVECQVDSECEGSCGNGDCTCEVGAACEFGCQSPPCHVDCQGDNAQCDGACANGDCRCGEGSSCVFACDAPPCHAQCEAGATCSLLCPDGYNGNCSLDSCETQVVECPDGITLACGVECPE